MSHLSNFNIGQILEKLHKDRQVFSNERDFQVSLCLTIKNEYKDFNNIVVIPEFSYLGGYFDEDRFNLPKETKKNYCDIAIVDKDTNEAIVIELKYKVTTDYKDDVAFQKTIAPCELGALDLEKYYFSNQGATDVGSLFFLEDMYRIEQLISFKGTEKDKYYFRGYKPIMGFSVLLTNDNDYWNKTKKAKNADKTRIFYKDFANDSSYDVDEFEKEDKHYTFSVKIPKNGFVWNEYSKIKYDESIAKPTHDIFKILVIEYFGDDVTSVELTK